MRRSAYGDGRQRVENKLRDVHDRKRGRLRVGMIQQSKEYHHAYYGSDEHEDADEKAFRRIGAIEAKLGDGLAVGMMVMTLSGLIRRVVMAVDGRTSDVAPYQIHHTCETSTWSVTQNYKT
jgi:hypothetical protein